MTQDITEVFRLSPQQKHLWLLQQADRSSAYRARCSVLIEGALDRERLQAAVERIVARHEILRTTFYRIPGVTIPFQVIHDAPAPPIIHLDLSHADAQQQAARLEEAWRQLGRLPLDDDRDSFLQLVLLTLAPRRSMLLVGLPALCADTMSLGNLARELARLYADPTPAEADPGDLTQYIDFAEWQNETLQAEDTAEARSYWQSQTFGPRDALRLPFEQRGDAARVFDPQSFTHSLSQTCAQQLDTLERLSNISADVGLLACWQSLLWRLSGAPELTLGVAEQGRAYAELQDALGLFAKFLPLPGRIEARHSFRELAEQAQVRLRAIADVQECFSWHLLAQQPDGAPAADFPPFSFEHLEQPRPSATAGVSFALHDIDACIDRFKLKLSSVRGDGGLGLTWHYDASIYSAGDVQRLAERFQTLLASALQHPDAPIERLELLSPAERRQLLAEFGRGPSADVADVCLHHLFEAQAARTPDAIAVVFEPADDRRPTTGAASAFSLQPSAFSLQLTYAELDRRANQLAELLRERGVGPEVLVGLCMERAAEMIVGMLGVLKAGGAYVPLDPDNPEARLAYQLADSQAALLITATTDDRPPTIDDKETRRQGDKEIEQAPVSLPPGLPVSLSIVSLARDWPTIAQQPATSQGSNVAPSNLAYVIYTSGSTGMPKGVAVSHRSLVNYTRFICEKLRLDAAGPGAAGALRYATVSTLAADLGYTVIFPALVSGGCLHILSYEVATDAERFAAYMAAHPIDVLKIVPSHLSALLSGPDAAQSIPRRQLILGGEALSHKLAARIAELSSECGVVNHYGPTETTVGALTFDLAATTTWSAAQPATVPIGRPIANAEVYILDGQHNLAPIGVAGELCIGGAGLARGYLGRPELTAEKFIPNPFLKDEGGRMKDESGAFILHPSSFRLYRTGDLARYLPDGTIEFLGRIDGQIKLRGVRIELGEIEAVLSRHPAVRQALVVVHENPASASEYPERRLVAYVVPTTDGRRPTTDDRPTTTDEGAASSFIVHRSSFPNELRSFLAERLPEYMLPSTFVLLDRLPLTPNGKLDRRALPAPDAAASKLHEVFVAPRTPVEELLAGMWVDLLGVVQVGVNDNFFVLGGHSLLATQLLARIRHTLQVDLLLRTLFADPTIAGLARQIEAQRQVTLDVQAPPIEPVARDGDLPLSFAQERLWFLDQLEYSGRAYNMAFTAQLKGRLDRAALERSLNEIARRHEVLRTTFAKVKGQPALRIVAELALRVPLLDLRGIPAEAREAAARRLIAEEAQHHFDLAAGPLVRLTALQLGERAYTLTLIMHHIVSDAWSMGVFSWELGTLYKAFAQGAPQDAPLPELPIQYVDYAVWQRRWLQGELRERQMEYWRRALASPIPVLDLPTDRLRTAVNRFQGAWQLLGWPRPLADSLKALSQRERATVFMTLLAAFVVLLHRYSRQDDILVGVPVANRTRREIEGLMGFFLNTLVLRIDLAGSPTFRELLRQVREVALSGYDHQDLPFEQVVQHIHATRDMNRNPLFQVMFNYQNTPRRTVEIPGLEVTLDEVDNGTAKFDLLLSLGDTPQGIAGGLEYNTDLFEAATIARMADHFQVLLEAIAADPDQRLAELPLLTGPEREQLLVEWNTTGRTFADDLCVHALFEAQVARTPDAIAVVCETTNGADSSFSVQRSAFSVYLTYAELNRRANQLAHHLRRLGVGPEVLVGICAERALPLVIGLLGILKAGGAYVPLDPTYPAERLAFMLADAQAPVLLTQRSLLGRLPQLLGHGLDVHVLCLDGDWGELARERGDDPRSGATAQNADYVLYTSGSTGRPKGVVLTHRGTLALFDWATRLFTAQELTAVLASTSICFDSSILELFIPLGCGGTVILADHAMQLPSLPAAVAVTMINTVPSAIAELANMRAIPASVRVVSLAGEPLQNALAQHIYQRSTVQRVINLYGLTEDTTYSTCAIIEKGSAQPVTIGRPIVNTQAYILDPSLRPVPIGVAGELYIGGERLARGYLRRPDLTAERFVPNPFATTDDQRPTTDDERAATGGRWSVVGGRLYRTGDLVRYRPDGQIEFLGRLDHQVKIRGFRVELGEVEAALRQHPSVQDTVVMAREDQPPASGHPDKRLVGYVVLRPGHAATIDELRRFVQEKLPSYMVPSALLLLDALPLTPNGKLDRLALPAPDTLRPELETAYIAPRTEVEATIAAIWQTVLRLDKVGINDNFFDLGGHSLLIVQVHSELQAALGETIALVRMFEYPTIKALAGYLSQGHDAQTAPQQGSDRANIRKALMQRRKQPEPKR